ncbi:Major facilitator superfamily domain general substrate transporter [Penicillium macrosclerotiorum]|uniref:Major facilitator superfamily domain general substrate transporter n=1 Tax=Penicillium macrosclerotiorum TaxID=303699 RepID=UPI0025467C39|nr:Major facilitator superfamily domain general substrate transporter [Penicillium macrosclerotiorum]KAJ5689451.1 Major facilitator superfamily domain general substrate transporter [Penicillium macrosclerotiorum]
MSSLNLVTLVFFFPETKFRSDKRFKSPENEPRDLNPKQGLEHLEVFENRPTVAGLGRPSKSQFMLWQQPASDWKTFLLRDIVSPFRVFLFPIIFWAGLNVAGPANLLLFWNLTESSVLGSEPYNFDTAAVGYSNFSFAVGGVIGLATAGPFSDWVAMRATARNGGIREAEMRLPALVPYCITTVIGIVIGGLGYQRSWDWPLILVIGYGFSGLCVTAVPTIAVAYAVDCYKPISGEIMVVATVIKNTCGFAMSYWVSPLAARKGWIPPTMVVLALTVGPILLGIPVYFFGKHLRRFTQNSPVHSYIG